VIAYLDASALVKRYIVERGSRETIALTAGSEMTATSIVSRAEVSAALAKAARSGLVTDNIARSARRSFAGDWPDLVRVPVTEALVECAETLAWDQGLRGHDAVQLASALSGRNRLVRFCWRPSISSSRIRHRRLASKRGPDKLSR
jgi:uncharacterized protein